MKMEQTVFPIQTLIGTQMKEQVGIYLIKTHTNINKVKTKIYLDGTLLIEKEI